jgi:hypothetical protein
MDFINKQEHLRNEIQNYKKSRKDVKTYF